ncbi:hypothetical protein K1719_024001 [Acacia pycnantha]|nr:hypothetical protein K1719_024001 [Acacia pycnantha]
MSKVVDFILCLKGYYEWKLASGIREWRYGRIVRITSFPKGSSSSITVGEGTDESLDESESSQYEQLLEFLHLSSEVSIEKTRTFNVLAFLFDHFGLRLLQAYLRETDGIEDLPMNSMEAVKLVQPSTRREGFSSIPNELEDEHKTIESTTHFQHEDLGETKTTTEASHKINTPLGDFSIDVVLKETSEQGPTLEDVAVADLKPRNSSVASTKEKQEQGSQGYDATRKATIAIQSTDSESMKQIRVSSIIAQSLEETKKEAVRRQASQLPIAPTATNLKSVTSSVVSQVEGSKSGPSTLSAKETTKGIDENATALHTNHQWQFHCERTYY